MSDHTLLSRKVSLTCSLNVLEVTILKLFKVFSVLGKMTLAIMSHFSATINIHTTVPSVSSTFVPSSWVAFSRSKVCNNFCYSDILRSLLHRSSAISSHITCPNDCSLVCRMYFIIVPFTAFKSLLNFRFRRPSLPWQKDGQSYVFDGMNAKCNFQSFCFQAVILYQWDGYNKKLNWLYISSNRLPYDLHLCWTC